MMRRNHPHRYPNAMTMYQKVHDMAPANSVNKYVQLCCLSLYIHAGD